MIKTDFHRKKEIKYLIIKKGSSAPFLRKVDRAGIEPATHGFSGRCSTY